VASPTKIPILKATADVNNSKATKETGGSDMVGCDGGSNGTCYEHTCYGNFEGA